MEDDKAKMGEKNVRRLYETIARIISEREGAKVTAKVKKKEEAA